MPAETTTPDALVGLIRAALKELADPAKAGPMQVYMKSEMPYLGVPAPIRRKDCNQIFRTFKLPDEQSWREAVLDLWRNATYREERYEAIDLCGFRYYDEFQTPDRLPMYEEMIITGAWWDFVDDLAIRRVGTLLGRYPAEMRPHMLGWSTSVDIWKRRTSIICQIKFKEQTDLELLYACIEPSIGEKEFFLRKAIGWALRAHAWVDPDEVAGSVDALLEEGWIASLPAGLLEAEKDPCCVFDRERALGEDVVDVAPTVAPG